MDSMSLLTECLQFHVDEAFWNRFHFGDQVPESFFPSETTLPCVSQNRIGHRSFSRSCETSSTIINVMHVENISKDLTKLKCECIVT